MNPERKIIWQHSTPHYNRSFLQPLAVALVCAVFIGLILTMGLIDLRRSERTLNGFMEDQGMRIVGVVERLTEENLKTMIQASQKAGGSAFVPLTEQVISPQIFLTDKIVAMAREIDNHWKREHLSASVYPSVCRGKEPLASRGPQCLGRGHLPEPDASGRAFPAGRKSAMKGRSPANAAESVLPPQPPQPKQEDRFYRPEPQGRKRDDHHRPGPG